MTIYYPTAASGSSKVTSKNNVIYRSAYYGTGTNYTVVVANGATSTTQLTNAGVTSSVLASMYGTFGGLNATVNNTEAANIKAINSSDILSSSTTTYYAVNTYTTSATATFYYSNSTAGAKTSTTASGTQTRNVYCSNTTTASNSLKSEGTCTAPSSPTGETAPYGTAKVNNWASNVNTMTVASECTTGGTYYRVYRSALTIYYPTGTGSSNISSKNNVIYRNAVLTNASDSAYTRYVVNGTSSLTQLQNSNVTNSILANMYGASCNRKGCGVKLRHFVNRMGCC